ncbi:MAG: M3 family oligoendopeptidase [Chloroflexi bacterium]|nr:M3 family oligoendopeptidase [Chloroflexota bacterium]
MSSAPFKPGRWNLNDILPATSGPEFDAIVDDLKARVTNFETHRAKLSDEMDAPEFLAILREYESLNTVARRLGAYSGLWFSEDTQSSAALTFQLSTRQMLTELGNRTLFFSLWWKTLRDDAAARLMQNSGDLRYYLESERLFKPHTLTEPEEKVINLKDVNGMDGLITLYSMLTNAYEFNLKVNGKTKKLTREALMMYVRDPDPAIRAAAYRELYRVFSAHGKPLAQIYAYRAQDWRTEQVQLRKFASPMAVRNISNDIPDAAVDTMLDVIRANAPVFQRYFKQKAKWLGVRKLRRYDIYAPLASSDKKYPYNKSVEMVLDSFNAFSPVIANHARRVFEEQHVDSEIRKGKASGAFCASVLPGMAPFVLLNYTGKARDVATMAHEFGHAIHALLASEHSVLTFHSALPLAETASVFGEMLLTEKLLAHEKNADVRRDILATKLDDTYATVLRQAFFVLFERDAHELIAQGKSVEELNARYLENLHAQFGDAVDVSQEFQWEWVSIPHFYHTPFYVYAYSFGNLLTLALYKQYRKEGDAFKPRYLKLLTYGGSASPAHMLAEAGIDMTSKSFWQGGFDVIAEWMNELEALPTKKHARKT